MRSACRKATTPPPVPRTGARKPTLTEADEAVTLAALTTGAREVAAGLARMLISQHPHWAG
ncbi:hypothetical protein [Streptomyces sp. NPDC057302]|uniref:hypothetical protein n=1 Tax=Streptomyces sp. NPDC057302 TaxID=3346094 RepID=UPI00362D7C63